MSLSFFKTIGRAVFPIFVLLLPVSLLASKPMLGNFDFMISVNKIDTNNVSVIQVTLGSTEGGSNLLIYNFNYDQKTGLPIGLAYSRNGANINLTLGNYPLNQHMFGVYKIINKGGQEVSSNKFIYK